MLLMGITLPGPSLALPTHTLPSSVEAHLRKQHKPFPTGGLDETFCFARGRDCSHMNTKDVILFGPMTTSSCPILFASIDVAHASHPVSINIVV